MTGAGVSNKTSIRIDRYLVLTRECFSLLLDDFDCGARAAPNACAGVTRALFANGAPFVYPVADAQCG